MGGHVKESQIQKKIIDYLEGRRFYVVKNIATNRKGTPDIIACSPGGAFLAIEVKTENGKLSTLQEIKLREIKKCKGKAMVAWGYDNFLTQFKNIFPTLVD